MLPPFLGLNYTPSSAAILKPLFFIDEKVTVRAVLKDYILIIAVAGLVFFTNLGRARLWDRDEPRNAGCAAEMMARGDWVVPVFNDELRTHKPVLLYWLMMSAYALLGVSELSARFWSALLAIGTVVATYHIGRTWFGASTARWASVVLATCLMFGVAGRAATPDSALIFFSTLGIAVYVLGSFRPAVGKAADTHCSYYPSSTLVVVLIFALLGIAVLAKGPVGFVLPTAVIGMFLLIKRLPRTVRAGHGAERGTIRHVIRVLRPFAPMHFLRTFWSMRPLTATAAALAVALPWYIWVGIRTDGAWLEGFFLEHNINRALEPMEGHHGSFLFYPLVLLVGTFPWSVLSVPVLAHVVRRIRSADPNVGHVSNVPVGQPAQRHVGSVPHEMLARGESETEDGTTEYTIRDGYIFCACWIGVYVALFTLAQTKLPNYITPAYPAVALLVGSFLCQWSRGLQAGVRWLRVAWGTMSVAGIGIAIGLAFAASQYLPGDQWLGVIGLIPVIGAVACLIMTESARPRAAACSLAATAILFAATLFGIGTARADRHQHNHLLLREIASRSDKPKVAAFGRIEPSWVFYGGRPIRFFPRGQAEAAQSFLESGADCFVITTDFDLHSLTPNGRVAVLKSVPYFLKNSQLVLVGPSGRTQRPGSPETRLPVARRSVSGASQSR